MYVGGRSPPHRPLFPLSRGVGKQRNNQDGPAVVASRQQLLLDFSEKSFCPHERGRRGRGARFGCGLLVPLFVQKPNHCPRPWMPVAIASLPRGASVPRVLGFSCCAIPVGFVFCDVWGPQSIDRSID